MQEVRHPYFGMNQQINTSQKVGIMAKKRKDGYYQTSFMHDGKRYYIYAKSKSELKVKEQEKRAQLQNGDLWRINPTITEYYNVFMRAREGKVKETTIFTQKNTLKI